FVEAAGSTHPSLIDQSHYMDARFGVTNIPQVIWIDENSTIVRPAEPASPMPVGEEAWGMVELIGGLEDRERYVTRVQDWVEKGADSRYALSPEEVVARSPARPPGLSEAAAHFELAQYLWRQEGFSERTIAHFNAAQELQPDNITYKRQAYSALAVSRAGGDDADGWTRFRQAPEEGEDWPFVSDFNSDMVRFEPELAARLNLPGAGND
ncbi:MAG TPA: ResA-like WAxxUGC motif-containing protein, partial [Acidimicrobiales bacterium]